MGTLIWNKTQIVIITANYLIRRKGGMERNGDTHISHVVLDSVLSEVGRSVDGIELPRGLDVRLLKMFLVYPQLVGDLCAQVHCRGGGEASPVSC